MNKKNSHIIKTVLFFISGFVMAQSPISLENAYEKALKNNLNLKTGQLQIEYQDKIKKSYAAIEPLGISAEYGQINSAYTDQKFSINQTLHFPGFYKNQKQVLIEEWKNALLHLDLQKWQLKKEIALVYNQLNYLDEKEKLLKKTDSIYTHYYKTADLRLKKGESNILEKTTAENYRSQAEIQLNNLVKDRAISLVQFNFLLNDDTLYKNEISGFFDMNLENENREISENAIFLKSLEQQKNIEKAKLSAEKSKLLPNVNLAYNNMSMYGNGADNQFYDRSKRFQSGTIGLGIPVFNGAQKSLIEGQKINQLIAENNYQIEQKKLKNELAKILGEYQKISDEQNYYQTTGLKNAETILKTANKLYYDGEINYLEWSILVNQSLEIQNKYVDNQKILNEKIIEINSLKTEN